MTDTEIQDPRPRTVIPIRQIETLALAIDHAFAQALDPEKRQSMVLPFARLDVVAPKWREATPQMTSMMTAIITIEWLSGHKVIVQAPPPIKYKPPPRPAKPPPQMHKCGHCGLMGLAGPRSKKCVWCGEKGEAKT